MASIANFRDESVYEDNEEGLDILSVKDPSKNSEQFKVSFSFYNASAVCMIMPKYERRIPPDVADFNEAQVIEFLRVCKDFTTAFDLTGKQMNVILSIHRKQWVSRKKCFHAHVCFGKAGKERYLEIFDEVKQQPPMSHFWLSEASARFVRRCWRIREAACPENIDRLHADCVRRWPTYSWQIAEKDEMEALGNVSVQDVPGFDLEFHKQQPMVGISWAGLSSLDSPTERPKDHLREYLRALDRLVDYLVDNVEGCTGAHLCISIHGHGFPGFGRDDVLGYIHVSGPAFYRICPEGDRGDWLNNYSNWDGKVYT